MSDRDERIEAAAKAAHEAEREWASGKGQSWEGCREVTREMRRVSARAALAAADAVQTGDDLTAEDAVCACLDETGGRQVELLERCLRCGALMRHDPPADDRRMVDRIMAVLDSNDGRDYTGSWGFTTSHGDEFRAGLRKLFEREFGGSAPSEDWRCECGDLNRDHEAFCYRCGAGQP